jgi:hypothetical protein
MARHVAPSHQSPVEERYEEALFRAVTNIQNDPNEDLASTLKWSLVGFP